VVRDYKNHERDTVKETERRIRLHLRPVFGTWEAASVTDAQDREYVTDRKTEGVLNASINREFALNREHCFEERGTRRSAVCAVWALAPRRVLALGERRSSRNQPSHERGQIPQPILAEEAAHIPAFHWTAQLLRAPPGYKENGNAGHDLMRNRQQACEVEARPDRVAGDQIPRGRFPECHGERLCRIHAAVERTVAATPERINDELGVIDRVVNNQYA
jgi:hypothetical protein